LVTTFTPGFWDSKVLARSVNAPVSDAAASTVSVLGAGVDVVALELLELLELLDPQPAAKITAASMTPSARERFIVIAFIDVTVSFEGSKSAN
jgi:hypothetical protein